MSLNQNNKHVFIYVFIYLYIYILLARVGSWEGTNGLVLKEDLLRPFEIPPPEKNSPKMHLKELNKQTNKQTNKQRSLQTAQKEGR